MRVYEVAKLLNISNKELMSLLEKKGFSVKSHMSVLSQEAIDAVERVSEQPKPSAQASHPSQMIAEKKEQNLLEEISLQNQHIEEKKKQEKDESRLIVIEPMTLAQAAELLQKPCNEIILALLKQGIVCTKNQMVPVSVIEKLARHYDIEYKRADAKKEESSDVVLVKSGAGQQERNPIVVVVGHVDHGKTTLLDFIRKTRVAQKEKGGITQHLGAYQAETDHGTIVFIDTPGHEAFSNIRGRGLKVADIAILVVAADDGVMPQTVEAIKKAKDAGVPVVVAINKIDVAEPTRVEAIKNELSRYGLLPEEWGGETLFMPISAKTGKGVDKLLEMLVLQAQVMDLKTASDQSATGFVLESKMEKGLGFVATIICQTGTLRIGDFFVAGHVVGRVNSLIDSFGKKIKEVGPSVPVLVAGFSELSHAGDFFEVISQDKFKKLKNSRTFSAAQSKSTAQENALKIIAKTDTTSSKEALLSSIDKLTGNNISIVYAGIGDITESDVILAANTDAIIVGLHVKTEVNAAEAAQKNIVRVITFDIIYKLLEHLELLIEKNKPVSYVSKKIGEAVVRKVFNVKDVGVIAGSYLKEGRFVRNGKIVAWRGKEKIGSGAIKSLERDRKSVKEVHTGFEFAFIVDGIDDWQIDDRAECFIEVAE